MTMRVASVAWKLRRIRRDGEFFAHAFDFVEQAYKEEVQLIVFPELMSLELLNLERELAEADQPRYLIQYAQTIEEWVARISKSSGLIIVGGSHFREVDGRIYNATVIGHPEFGLVFGYKNNLTTYERETWRIYGGRGLAKPHEHRIGVTICYDAEFPESARALAEEGVLVQCVPAFTETRYGHDRVRMCAHARAIENQNFVIHSALVGDLGREPVPATYGSSAIIGPSLPQFPEGGVLDETHVHEEGMAIASLDFGLLEQARETGDVRNWNDRHRGEWSPRRVLD